ncbi:MAG: phosphoribosylanthranilate isomerase [Dehalococcoidia bacterium]
MATPRTKIDGLSDARHAQAAALAGADFLGFVFVEGVRRQLQSDHGAAVIARYRSLLAEDALPGPQVVGVFRNQPAAWVNDVADRARLDIVHLCGGEDEAFYAEMCRPILRQLRVEPGTTPDELRPLVRAHLDAGRMVVLDAYDPSSPGGSGRTFDWTAAEGIANLEGVFLAGGLTPENVAGAIARVSPWGVDVSSGVETGGVKDPDRIRAFLHAAVTPRPA